MSTLTEKLFNNKIKANDNFDNNIKLIIDIEKCYDTASINNSRKIISF